MARGRGHGGYRKPSSPAAVSGPGALSRRTDGGGPMEMTGLPYGQNQAVNDMASSAPMGGGPPPGGPGGSAPPPGQPPFNPDGAFGPTTRPDEPMTAGVDAGPGAGQVPGLEPMNEIDMVNRAMIAAMQRDGFPDLAEYLLELSRD